MGFNLTEKLMKYKRILMVTKRPSMAEFKAIVKVSAIGMLLIGAIGFVIHILAVMIRGM